MLWPGLWWRGRLDMRALMAVLETSYRLNGRRSWRRVASALRQMAAVFGEQCNLGALTTADLMAYCARRMERVARGTVHYELSILRHGLRLLRDAGAIAAIPRFPPLRPSAPRRGFFEDHELELILRCLRPDLVPLVRWLAITGWRVGEALGLRWTAVDWQHGVLRIEDTKNDLPRTLPWAALPQLESLLRAQRGVADKIERLYGRVVLWVFPRADGERIGEYGRPWREACLRAGLEGRLVHDLRRTAVRRLERAGVPRSVAMRITGHKTERIYSRYAITSEKDLAEGLRRLATLIPQWSTARAP